jgi:hypothetical protein
MECLNHYSNIIIALAAIASAVFAGVIWCETKKYRQITGELKDLNKRIVDKEQPNLIVNMPSNISPYHIESDKDIVFSIPLWIVNLSSKPDTILYLHVKQNGEGARVYTDFGQSISLKMPLSEPINLAPMSSVVEYVRYQIKVRGNEGLFPTVKIEIGYIGINQELKIKSFIFQVNELNKKYELTKLENEKNNVQ